MSGAPRAEELPAWLRGAGERYLQQLGPELGAADPSGSVSRQSRLLCAALGELAVASYQALGGVVAWEPVGLGAAALSLLTKIDDEVIDARQFHGGGGLPRDELAARTRAFLSPTRRSIRAAAAINDEPRCRFAGMVGDRLTQLAGPHHAERLERLLAAIDQGWEIQVDAVTVLTAAPASLSVETIARTTRAISGAWLSMMVLCGMLPADAARPVSEHEVTAIWDWGSYIQRADALCDLEKDQRDGLGATYVARRALETGFGGGSLPELYAHVAAVGIDRECLPSAAERGRLERELASLGRVPWLLDWIHRMLVGRYLSHRCCARAGSRSAEVLACSAP